MRGCRAAAEPFPSPAWRWSLARRLRAVLGVCDPEACPWRRGCEMDAGSGHQANTHASPGTATYQETVGKGKCAVPQHLAVKVQLWIPLAFRDKSDHVDGCRHIGRGSELFCFDPKDNEAAPAGALAKHVNDLLLDPPQHDSLKRDVVWQGE